MIENSKKMAKKIQKIKKHHYGFISGQNRLEKGCERETIKIILPFRSYTVRDRKFQKKNEKIKKIPI